MQDATSIHLGFIQAIIARMAGNSFLIKGWSVTVSAALFALAANDANRSFAIVALLPALAFWGLDAYYLRQERLFRRLYNESRHGQAEVSQADGAFSLSIEKYQTQVSNWFQTLWSPAIFLIHGTIVGAIAATIVVLSFSAPKGGSCGTPSILQLPL